MGNSAMEQWSNGYPGLPVWRRGVNIPIENWYQIQDTRFNRSNREETEVMQKGIYQDSNGQSFCDIDLRHRDGRSLATVRVRTAGHTHTGVASFIVANEGLELVYNGGSWDCREWQWWKDHGYNDDKRPRNVPAISGYTERPEGVSVTSRYTCDGIETSQEWMFRDQEHDDILTYDCRHTIRNCRDVDLVEYAQFFACYTEANRDRSGFYWSKDGTFKSFQSVGGHHLDAYIVAPGAGFERRGVIPHAFRGGGRVADTWHHPVLVGHPTPKGSRHIVFTEPTTTAGLASGMGGIAMDYIAYPGCDIFKAGEIFSIRVRHHIVRMPGGIDITLIEQLWGVWVNGLMG
jgi:hypothetical protein